MHLDAPSRLQVLISRLALQALLQPLEPLQLALMLERVHWRLPSWVRALNQSRAPLLVLGACNDIGYSASSVFVMQAVPAQTK